MATFPTRQPYCPYCGKSMRDAKPQARYCSRQCKLSNDRNIYRRRQRQKTKDRGLPIHGDTIECAHPLCEVNFTKKGRRKYCSHECAVSYLIQSRSPYGFGDRCAVYFRPCADCGSLQTVSKRGGMTLCDPCRLHRYRAVNARRNHKRRAVGAATMNIKELAARDGERCHICNRKIDLSLSGMAKWGPTIDHILPVSLGGTNDPNNLTLAHRCCNTRRGNREPAQMLLSA